MNVPQRSRDHVACPRNAAKQTALLVEQPRHDRSGAVDRAWSGVPGHNPKAKRPLEEHQSFAMLFMSDALVIFFIILPQSAIMSTICFCVLESFIIIPIILP